MILILTRFNCAYFYSLFDMNKKICIKEAYRRQTNQPNKNTNQQNHSNHSQLHSTTQTYPFHDDNMQQGMETKIFIVHSALQQFIVLLCVLQMAYFINRDDKTQPLFIFNKPCGKATPKKGI